MTENKDEYDAQWEQKWTKGETPWDSPYGAPILTHYVEQHYKHESNIRRALVPGCGRGRDVLTLCHIPSVEEVVGIDLSHKALELSAELVKETRETDPSINKAKFLLHDFFTLPNDQKFDLIFDYTFLCALHPTMRDAWADKYKELVRPGGELFTLIYPLRVTSTIVFVNNEGPPYLINYELVKDLLEKRGFVNIENRACDQSFEKRKGNEWIARWRLQE